MLYGCETLSLTLEEECRISVFEDRILRRMFGPRSDKSGEWGILHNEELYSLYRSPNTIRPIKYRRLKWARHMAGMEEGSRDLKIFTYMKETFRSVYS